VSLLFDLKEYETPVTVSDDWRNDGWETPDRRNGIQAPSF
jgi:hypothetical protein